MEPLPRQTISLSCVKRPFYHANIFLAQYLLPSYTSHLATNIFAGKVITGNKWAGKINRGYFCHNCLIIIAYPDKKPGCRFAPFAFPMKTGMSLRSICDFAYLLNIAFKDDFLNKCCPKRNYNYHCPAVTITIFFSTQNLSNDYSFNLILNFCT